MRPFCLRHRLTLEAVDSPLLPGSPAAGRTTPKDLLLAARICSIADPFKAVNRVGFWDKVWWARMMINPLRFARELVAWRTYLLDTCQHPKVGVKADGPRTARDKGVHWSLTVASRLIQMGFTEDEAWTMPEGRAMFYFYADAIRDGAEVEIITTEVDTKIPKAKEAVARAIKQAQEAAQQGRRSHRKG